MVSIRINSEEVSFAGDPGTPLLWVIRDHLKLRGTKYGCGIGQCGACTVHVDGVAQRSCVTPVSAVAGRSITTIEGLAPADGGLHPVQRAWLEHDVPQCGYCQAGQIMAAVDFLKRFPDPSDADIDENVTNICRCGTYVRIRKAIHRAAELSRGETS
jgi:isoquinoline 1-oxidoreductase alpha subunit